MELQRIGLTGGIGAGKSTVAELWRAEGMWVIDLDAHSRAVLDVPGPGVEEAVARFGETHRLASGTIDRASLAAVVFADAAARADLESIVLARVDAAVVAEERAARAAGQTVIVHDNPLLLEQGREGDYAAVIGVLAPCGQRIARLVADRGRTVEYVRGVLAAQVTDLERIRRCDYLVLNNAGRHALADRARRALSRVLGDLAP